jgi:hypothetical protein
MRSLFLLTIALSTVFGGSISLPVAAQVLEGSGRVRGISHYSLAAAPGWMIDDKAAAAEGVPLVFYPQDSSWQKGEAVIYTRSREKISGIRNAADVARSTVADFHQNGHSNYQGTLKETIKIGKLSAKIYWFKGDNFGSYEAAAYIERPGAIDFLVLNARNQSAFQKSLPAFMAIVKSYQPLMSSDH